MPRGVKGSGKAAKAPKKLTKKQLEKFVAALKDKETFKIAVMSEADFMDTCACPHCNETEPQPMLLSNMEEIMNHFCEMHLCQSCLNIFIIATYPTLDPDTQPVFLNFFMKDGSVDGPPNESGKVAAKIVKDLVTT